MLVNDLQLASVVEDHGFQRLLKVMDPKYELLSRRTIMSELLPNLYTKRKQELVETLSKVEYCALTTDLIVDIKNNFRLHDNNLPLYN